MYELNLLKIHLIFVSSKLYFDYTNGLISKNVL